MSKKPTKGAAPTARKDSHPGYFRGTRADGWNNVFTGQGMKGIDRSEHAGFARRNPLDPETLRAMYRSNGLIRRVVDLPAKEMTRAGFIIHEDPEGLVQARFQELHIHKKVRDMLRWASLFGGSLGVMGADDGQPFDRPLNEKRIRNLHFLHVFHRWRVTWNWGDLYGDPRHPKYGQPQWFEVTPVWGLPFRVHESRCIKVDGLPVDDLSRFENNDWGDSTVEACYEEFRDMGSAYGATRIILEDFIQAVLSMKGLSALIEGGQEEIIKKRLKILDNSRHVLHTLLLDADGEQYQKHASSVAGLADLLDRFAQKASAVTGIPVTLLMGQSPNGLNATGDGERSNWEDDVKDKQEEILQPAYERLCKVVFLARDLGFGGVEPEGWEIKFNPLRQLSPKEKGDLDSTRATTAKIYIDAGVLDPMEVRHSAQVEEFVGEPVDGDLEPPEEVTQTGTTAGQAKNSVKGDSKKAKGKRRGG